MKQKPHSYGYYKKDLWAASGVHAYLVKKYGIEKVCKCCIGGK